MTGPRFPLAPLAAALGIRLGQVGGHQPDSRRSGLGAIADIAGVSDRTARRYARDGLSLAQADEIAVRAGTLPELVWPNWWHLPNLHGTAARNASQTHCPAGHPYDSRDNRGRRTCRTCRSEAVRRHRAKTLINTVITGETAA